MKDTQNVMDNGNRPLLAVCRHPNDTGKQFPTVGYGIHSVTAAYPIIPLVVIAGLL